LAQKSLYILLSSLSKAEFSRFEEMVSSPFFNKRNDLIRFIGYLGDLYPEFHGEKVTDDLVYEAVYGSKNFNKQVVKNLLARMLIMVEKYFVQLGMEKDEFLQVNALARELQRKGRLRQADKMTGEKIEKFDKHESYSLEYYRKKHELLEIRHNLIPGDNSRLKITGSRNRFSASLKYFLVSLLRAVNDYEVHSFVESPGEAYPYIEEITEYIDFEKTLELIKANEPEEYPLIACYYYGLMSKTNDPDGVYREKLKELAISGIDSFRHSDNIEFWQMIFSSYIFSKSAKGPVDVKRLHEINKIYVDKNVAYIDEEGYIAESSYHNITMQAVAAGDLKWAEDFISKFKEQLNPAIRDNTYNFLMGYFMMTKHEYENVIPYLTRIKTTDIPTNLTIRWMFIRTFYELGHFFEAEAAITAFKKFISMSGRVTKESRSSYPQLLSFMTGLIKAKTSGLNMKEEIYIKAKNTSFIAKNWVIEKMDELVGKQR
jgi:hypothetical protein